jgi:hypothetical protein
MGGKNMLTGGNYSKAFLDNITGLTDMDEVVGITDSELATYFLDNDGRMFWLSSSNNYKYLGDMGGGSNYSDIYATNIIDTAGSVVENPILFTLRDYVGMIYEGTRTGLTGYGTSTFKLQDTAVDFTKMGLVAGDRVHLPGYEITATIDNGGIAANELTLTPDSNTGTGSDTTSYIVFAKQWNSLSDTSSTYGRKIIELDGDFYILNGSFLAIVDGSMGYTADSKAVDKGFVLRCGDSNGNTILVGANNAQGKGRLFLWDKSSNGWNNKITLNNTISCIKAYGDGYIFLDGGILKYTNGYTYQDLQTLPDYKIGKEPDIYPNSMTIVKDTLLISTSYDPDNSADKGRRKGGIYTYNILTDHLSYSPFSTSLGLTSYGYTRCIYNSVRLKKILYGLTADVTGESDFSAVNEFILEGNTNSASFITSPIKLEKNNNESANIKKVEINIIASPDYEIDTHGDRVQVDLRLSDCSKHIWGFNQIIGTPAVNSVNMYHASGYTRVEAGEVFYTLTREGYIKRNIDTVTTVDTTSTVTFTPVFATAPLAGDLVDVLPFKRYGDSPKIYTHAEDTAPITRLTFESIYLTADNVMLEVNISGDKYPNFLIKDLTIFYD